MPSPDTTHSIRQHVILIAVVCAVLIGGMGLLGAATELAGAIISSGTIVVESNVKKVQHPTGGIIKDILVHEGSQVHAGDLLITLDETVASANLAAVSKSLSELDARRARLEAERDGQQEVAFPRDLATAEDPALVRIVAGEQRLFELRRQASDGQKSQLRERITQLRDEITGLEDQLAAKQQEMELVKKELAGVEELWNQRLVSFTRYAALEREAARLLGERGQLTSSIAQAKGRISETELQIIQVDQDFRSAVAKELADVRAKSSETFERKVAARDQFNRLEIRAPQDGVVHDLDVHTKGGVIAAGEKIMLIVPDNDTLLIETHVAPQDIDQVTLGQSATLRFPNFNQRTTPELAGEVVRVGADVTRDDKASPAYFVVRLAIADSERARLGAAKLVPGMPVDVFIQTRPRTVLSYLVKPLADQARRAFREK